MAFIINGNKLISSQDSIVYFSQNFQDLSYLKGSFLCLLMVLVSPQPWLTWLGFLALWPADSNQSDLSLIIDYSSFSSCDPISWGS